MRSKVEKPPSIPVKFRRYRPADWLDGGWYQFVKEREAWNLAQEPVLITGQHHDRRLYSYPSGPLGDTIDLLRARREARLIDWAGT